MSCWTPRRSPPPDSPDIVAERIAHRAACEQAHREMLARFGAITAANAREATAWQATRIVELEARP